MNWQEFLQATTLNKDIVVTLIKPLRNPLYEGDKTFTKGHLTGFKSGIMGGGHYNYEKLGDGLGSVPMSFDSSRIHWIKKPKVHITYNAFKFGGKEYSDWVNVDNCTFEIVNNDQSNT